jgi:hypothetical protein
MLHGTQPRRLEILLALALIGAGCAASPRTLQVVATEDHTLRLRLVDHLGFGARVVNVSVLVDGEPALVSGAASAPGEADLLLVQPGSHTLSIVARASEPCGLLDEPRASVTVRADTTLSVGQKAGDLEADLYAREATSDPLRAVTVRFTGHGVALGTPPDALDASRRCGPDDALCVLGARAELARSHHDAAAASCFDSKLAEARALRDTLDDSYTAVTREQTTAGDAENAQLRARYARSRLRSLPAEAEACAVASRAVASAGVVERKVERACPTPDVTAGLLFR